MSLRTLRVITLALAAAAAPAAGCIFTSCFVAGTRIATPEGDRPIEALRVGDEVLSWSLDEARTVVRRVTALHRAKSREVRRLTIEGLERSAVTLEHPFWVVSRGWVPVRELREGERVLALSAGEARELPIQSITAEEHATPDIEVFNITVEEPESCYFADGILVHNKSMAAPPSCANVQYSAPSFLSGTASAARMRVTVSIPQGGTVASRVIVAGNDVPSSVQDLGGGRDWAVDFDVPWGAQATVIVSGSSTGEDGGRCDFGQQLTASAPQGDGGVDAGPDLDAAPDAPGDAPADAPSAD